MKKVFENCYCEIIKLEQEDVISTSGVIKTSGGIELPSDNIEDLINGQSD
jgi:hypothetical protein